MRQSLVVALALALLACSADGQPPSTQAPPPVAPGATSTTAAPATTAITAATGTPPTTTAPPPTEPPSIPTLAYQPVAELDFPLLVTARPGDDEAFVVQRPGQVRRLVDGAVEDEPVLDLSGQVATGFEQGFLGLVRHPDDDGRMFLHYSDPAGDTVVSEMAYGGASIDPSTEEVLLTVDQPAANHNGGMIQFGPDGALYLGLGDGGGAGDQFGNAQNLATLLGGLVRIDVDSGSSELWFHGLRNPWRFWIDGAAIYIADVGQGAYEEVNVTPLADPGLNFGWPITEGLHCFQADDCDTTGLVVPVIEVEHGDGGTCSITGGVVYRGSAIPGLEGVFLYSDFCGGYLRGLRMAGGEMAETFELTDEVGVPGGVTSFGVDGAGEAYVTTTDQVLALVAGE